MRAPNPSPDISRGILGSITLNYTTLHYTNYTNYNYNCNYNYNYTTLRYTHYTNYITLHPTTLHSIALQLHYTTLH